MSDADWDPDLHILRLGDGRRIGYRMFGAAAGFPLLALHGLPGSSFKFVAADAAARARGVRIVAPDRWGYGATDMHPRPALAAFAGDMAELLDHLGIGRYAVLGMSAGGPYAAALAAEHGSRVVAAALVSPVGPIAGTSAVATLLPFHRLVFVRLARHPWVLRCAFHAFRQGLRIAPDLAMRIMVVRAPTVDRAVIRVPAIRARLARAFALGLRPGVAGCCTDMALFARPWDVPLTAATARARLWLGTEDRNVPLAAARGLAFALPGCEVVDMHGEGHLWVARHYDQVLEWVASAIAQAGARPYM